MWDRLTMAIKSLDGSKASWHMEVIGYTPKTH